jgi:microcystin-dependent protein
VALNFPDNPTINQVYSDPTAGFYYKWDGTVWQSYSPSSAANIKTLDDISSGFNGIGKTFSLTSGGAAVIPINTSQLVINLGGIVQDPSDDYITNGSNIIFSESPETGLSFSGISLGPAVPLTDLPAGSIAPDKLTVGGPWWQSNYNVGIGTTLPTSALNVIGDTNISGVITANTFKGQINSGFATITSAVVGSAVTINNAGIVAVGVITANTFVGNINGNVSGNVTGDVVGNIYSTGISTITNLTTTSITSQNLRVSGITTLGSSNGIGTVTIGTGVTALLVDGNARITGILSIGQGTITLNGSNNTISGVSSISDATGSYLSIPPGTVISVASSTAPAGYLKANGAAISRSTYFTLFAGIGTVHGAGDGSTTFNIPDLRGEFIRGWADGRAVDTGRSFGSSQADAHQDHTHSYTVTNDQNTRVVPSTNPAHVFLNQGTAAATTGAATGNTATETRPRNIALLYCIKY